MYSLQEPPYVPTVYIIFFSCFISLHFAMKYLNVPDPLLRRESKTLHAVLKQKPVMFQVKSFFFFFFLIMILNFFGTE